MNIDTLIGTIDQEMKQIVKSLENSKRSVDDIQKEQGNLVLTVASLQGTVLKFVFIKDLV